MQSPLELMSTPEVKGQSRSRTRLLGTAWRVLRVLVALALVVVLLLRTDLGRVAALVRGSSVFHLVLAALALFGVFAASTLRWKLLIRATGGGFSFWYLLRLFLSAVAMNSVLPTALGGDVLRMVYTTGETDPADGVSTVLVDRAVALAALLVMSLTASLVLLVESGRGELVWLSVVGLVVLALGTAGVFVDAGYRVLAKLLGAIRLLRLGERILRVVDGVRAFRAHGGALASAFVLSLFIRVLYCSVWYLLGLALGATAPFLHYLLYVQFVSILTMIPLSIGGVGIRENAFAILMSRAGMARDQGTAIALLFLALNYSFALLGGVMLVLLRRGKARNVQPA